MSLTEPSSTLTNVTPDCGGLGRTTRPCSMPGTRTFCTYSNEPVTFAGMSTRGTERPTTVYSPGLFGSAVPVSSISKRLPPIRLP
jgi:hypothetical protein